MDEDNQNTDQNSINQNTDQNSINENVNQDTNQLKATPTIDFEMLKAVVGEVLDSRANVEQQRMRELLDQYKQPVPEQMPYDPSALFVIEEGKDEKEQSKILTERINKLVEHRLQQVLVPMQQQLQQLGGATFMMNKLQENPDIKGIQSDVLTLVQTGKADFDTAVELVKLRKNKEAVPRPIPPKSAASPTSSASSAHEQKKYNSVRELMMHDPEIQTLLGRK